jgi:hypothetical protein
MPTAPVLVLTAEGTHEITVDDDGRHLWVDPAVVSLLTGWDPKPEGLCRGDLCVPVRSAAASDAAGRYDLSLVAEALHRPLALERLDDGHIVLSLGEAAHERAAAFAEGLAPRLVLSDLAGNAVAVPDLERRKRVLLAWSSW